jgi:hypothetical protein
MKNNTIHHICMVLSIIQKTVIAIQLFVFFSHVLVCSRMLYISFKHYFSSPNIKSIFIVGLVGSSFAGYFSLFI